MRDQCKVQTGCLESRNASRIYFCCCCSCWFWFDTWLINRCVRLNSVLVLSALNTCFVFEEIWLSCVNVGSDLIVTYCSVCTTKLQKLPWLPGKFLWLRLIRLYETWYGEGFLVHDAHKYGLPMFSWRGLLTSTILGDECLLHLQTQYNCQASVWRKRMTL